MNCIILKNQKLAEGFFYLSIKPKALIGGIKAGQFVMVRVGTSSVPLLRRPMGIADFKVDGSEFGLLIQITGIGTRLLSNLVPGDNLDVLGPFGNGFPPDLKGEKIWAVAGGTGVAPFMGIAANNIFGNKFKLLLGARSADFLLQTSFFSDRGIPVDVSTEDSTKGFGGLVTELVDKNIKSNGKPDVMFTCGPISMMKALASIADEHNIPLYASLENRMACGFGVCLGCVLKKQNEDRFFTVCRKGPVFLSSEVEILNT